MLLKLQQAIIGLNARAEQSSMFRTLRSTLVSGAAFFRTPSNATTAIAGMMEIEAKHRAETDSWVNPEALASGTGGAFAACDLRHWLAMDNRAGVDLPSVAMDKSVLDLVHQG